MDLYNTDKLPMLLLLSDYILIPFIFYYVARLINFTLLPFFIYLADLHNPRHGGYILICSPC